jgi:hypothetical protein
MANLYTPIITNTDLLNHKSLRHKKFNLDYEYIAGFPHVDTTVFNAITWQTIDFSKANVANLNPVQGIYMFTFNPYRFSKSTHNADLVFYIGQANNLPERLSNYFNYIKSKKASDQEKRTMILLWGDYLKIKYFETVNWSQSRLDDLEYGLIDSILPPFNLRIRSEFAQAYRRLIN